MKKALISTIEPITNFDGSTGIRVAQVENASDIFEVAEGLYWVDCNDNVIADEFYFDDISKSILPVPKRTATNPQPTASNVTSI